MFIGAVKWFNGTKGFGVISLPQDVVLFLHINSFRQKPNVLKPGDVIIGETKPSAKHDRLEARNCHLANSPADWPVLTKLLGKPDDVTIDYTTENAKHSNVKQKCVSLLSLGMNQLLSQISANHIITMVANSLWDLSLTPETFMVYARSLESAVIRTHGGASGKELLNKIFLSFGDCVTPDILFRVWKTRNFRYIGYSEQGDYEIPEEILNRHSTELEYHDLNRILQYSYGQMFCAEIASAMLEDAEVLIPGGIQASFPFLNFLADDQLLYWKNRLAEQGINQQQ